MRNDFFQAIILSPERTLTYSDLSLDARPMIPQQKIDEIRQSIDIVDIIADYVKLQPSGRNYKALSPFAAEKTPSFVVSPDKQIYKCFSSGKGGNVFTFLMEVEKISFPEAIEIVARRAGIDISQYRNASPVSEQQHSSEFDTLKWAGRLYNRQLHSTAGKEGLNYLINTRKLSGKTITTFGLGYAPDSWNFLTEEARRSGIPAESLSRTGLLYRNERKNSSYDYFRNRIMFPIFSVAGQVIGFGGRTLSTDPGSPKYLNSPETALFDKSKVLYGLHAARDEIRRKGQAILVEGYMDVLALHQAGISTAVASCGTALTKYQAAMLQRYCSEVLFLYDADAAGQKSMLSGIDILISCGLTPWTATLPEGDDPDSYIRKEGKEAFLDYTAANRLSFLDFQLAFHRKQGTMDHPRTKAAAVRSMLKTINLVQDSMQKELYLQELEQKLGISMAVLREIMRQVQEGRKNSNRHPEPPNSGSLLKKPEKGISVLEKTFLKSLLESVEYGNEVLDFAASHEELLRLANPAATEVLTHLLNRYRQTLAHSGGSLDLAAEIGSLENPEARNLASGLLIDPPVSAHWQESFDEEEQKARRCLTAFLDSFKHLILNHFRQQKKNLHLRLQSAADLEEEKTLTSQLNGLIREEQKTESDVNSMIRSILNPNG